MKLWVAGATGFLGSHLVRRLLQRGHEVVAVSRTGGQVDGHPVTALDVLDPQRVAESAAACDGAFLATGRVSRNPDDAAELHRLHVTGTSRCLEGLERAGVKRVVYASTSGTVAVSTDPERIADESDEAPLELIAPWPYYRTKLFGERVALDTHRSGFEVVVVNPSLLLGPGDLRESSTGDVRRFLERAIPAVPAGGMAFVDVRDAAEGMWLAFERGRGGQRYLLNAANLTVAAFFQRLSRITNIPAPLLRLPKNRALALGAHQLYEKALRAIGGTPVVDETSVAMAQCFWYCDSSRAERELDWTPRDPGETLRDTVFDLVERRVAMPPSLAQWSRTRESAAAE
jgi:dihydroflavonol-4-reductase